MSVCVVFEWEQPGLFEFQQVLIAREGRTGDGRGRLTVLRGTDVPENWFTAWSAQTIGADIEPSSDTGTNRTSFGLELSIQSLFTTSSLGVGVTGTPREQLSVVGPVTYAARNTDFVLTCGERDSQYLSYAEENHALGMCGISDGLVDTPLLSVTPKATGAEERADTTGSGFLRAAPAVTVVGVVCDFDRNSLMFYVDDQVVQNTRISYDPRGNPKVDDNELGKPRPFEWLIPKQNADLRECRVYLTLWHAELIAAEFVEWSPPPPPPLLPPSLSSTDNI